MNYDEVITPEKAIQLLRKDGLEVTLEQAKLIISFMSVMAEIVIDQYLKKVS